MQDFYEEHSTTVGGDPVSRFSSSTRMEPEYTMNMLQPIIGNFMFRPKLAIQGRLEDGRETIISRDGIGL